MNDYQRGYQAVTRTPWTEEQLTRLAQCLDSINLNDGEKFSEKEFIANLERCRANKAGITDKQAALLLKIYNRRVLCISERPRNET